MPKEFDFMLTTEMQKILNSGNDIIINFLDGSGLVRTKIRVVSLKVKDHNG